MNETPRTCLGRIADKAGTKKEEDREAVNPPRAPRLLLLDAHDELGARGGGEAGADAVWGSGATGAMGGAGGGHSLDVVRLLREVSRPPPS